MKKKTRKPNKRSQPRTPASELRHIVYPFITNYGTNSFVQKWKEVFGCLDRENAELNILVFCAVVVEPLHRQLYPDTHKTAPYSMALNYSKMNAVCCERFLGWSKTINKEQMLWNVEYTALLRGAFLARTIRQGQDNAPQSNDEDENVLAMEETQHEQISEKPITGSMERSVSGLRVFRLYEEFMKQVAELRKETWFHDVTFSLASGNSVNTETISSKEAADTLAMFIEQNTITTEEAQLRDLISETFALNGKDNVVSEICKIIKSAR